MSNKSKQSYEPPFLEVTKVETEGTIADSDPMRVELEPWNDSDNTYATYDGDIWLDI